MMKTSYRGIVLTITGKPSISQKEMSKIYKNVVVGRGAVIEKNPEQTLKQRGNLMDDAIKRFKAVAR